MYIIITLQYSRRGCTVQYTCVQQGQQPVVQRRQQQPTHACVVAAHAHRLLLLLLCAYTVFLCAYTVCVCAYTGMYVSCAGAACCSLCLIVKSLCLEYHVCSCSSVSQRACEVLVFYRSSVQCHVVCHVRISLF